MTNFFPNLRTAAAMMIALTLFSIAGSVTAQETATNLAPSESVFDNQADFEAAVKGDIINGEFQLGGGGSGSLESAFGQLNADADLFFTSSRPAPTSIDSVFSISRIFALFEEAEIVPDPALGNITAVGIEYAHGHDSTLCIELADGTVEVVPVPGSTLTIAGVPIVTFVGWTNTTGQAVSSILFKSDESTDFSAIASVTLGFGDCEEEETNQGLLADLIAGLEAKLEGASPNDQYFIQCAIGELQDAQNDALWDTENRLSDYGHLFFENVFYATYFLGCVSDQDLVSSCLIDTQVLLGNVVDEEIMFALENPDVDTNLLAYAEYFEDYADAFADAEHYVSAVLLHFYAWLFANNA